MPQNTPMNFFKWLVVELAPTVFGGKPATVLSLANCRRLSRLTFWHKYGPQFLRQSCIEWEILRESESSIVVVFYHPSVLSNWLGKAEHAKFLAGFGYDPEASLIDNIKHLKMRYEYGCPHEIGLLLGIPLKDVLGFMGKSKECLSCRGMWCIYGDPEPSLLLMKKIVKSREQAQLLLLEGSAPRNILLGAIAKTA